MAPSPPGPRGGGPTARPHLAAHPTAAERQLRFLRYSHIFASAVHEILEVKLLRETTPLALTVSQFHLLRLMSSNGRHQVGQVADFLGVSPPAATKNIDKLERLGLVIRKASTGDRRATLLSVSPKGRRVVHRYDELTASRLAPLLRRFPPEEIERLSDLLQRLAVSLLNLEESGGGVCLRCAAYIELDCPVGRLRNGCPYQKVRDGRGAQRHGGTGARRHGGTGRAGRRAGEEVG